MPVYQYKASRLNGKTVAGEMQASGRAQLQSQLQEQNLFLTSCTEVKDTTAASKKLNALQLAEFCRELGTMLGAGVPLIRALSIMAKRDIPKKQKEVYTKLYRALKQGSMLSDAMAQQGNVFPDLLISMYRASEASGQMDITSEKMAVHYEKAYRLSKKVRSAMVYPIILSCVTLLVLLVVFLVVLPKFFALFETLDTALPPITQFMLDLSIGLKNNWLFVLIGVLLLVLGLKMLFTIAAVKRWGDRTKLRLPIVGRLMRTICTARFARTLSSCYASGLSIIASLNNTRDTVGNTYIAAQFPKLISDVRSGKSLSQSIRGVEGLDSKLSATIQIGEETGKLYEMLDSMANSFDYESEIALGRLTAMLEPIMIVIMAVVIGTVIISVMLPLTTLYDAIGSAA